LAWLYLAIVSLAAQPPAEQAPPCFIPCRILGTPHDCDTFKADILLPWGVTLRDRTIRTDYDAWEVNRVRRTVEVTDEEIRRGKQGLAALVEAAGPDGGGLPATAARGIWPV